MTTLRAVPVLVALVLAVAGCSDPAALTDEASCPGSTCTEDAQERVDAIADLDRVTAVEDVSRTYGLDRGAFHSAVVEADVGDADQAREVALAVLAVLESWPGRDPSSAEATVLARAPVTVDGVAREAQEVPEFYEPCASSGCRTELGVLTDRLTAELEGVDELELEVDGGRLLISGRADPELATLAARGTLRIFSEQAVALADRVEVRLSYRSPLAVTWRLVEGRVCEQPPGEAMVSCEARNSIPFGE